MAENDVGGIGVKFTAEAAQLQAELQKLEQRLKQFDSAHGQKKVRLQAELVMPGARALQDFRRDLEKGFGAQGSAGRVKARIELIPPTATDIKTISAKVGAIKVKVVGNFEWGKAPPKTVTVKVVEESGSLSVSSKAGGKKIGQTVSQPIAAGGPSHEEILRSREAYRRREREGGGAASFARGSAFVGGAASFARGAGDDPYQQNILREQRASMREAAKTKALAQEARDRARADEVKRKWAARGANLTAHEAALRSVEMREIGIGEPLGPGGQIPLGLGRLGPRQPVQAVDRRPRATPPPPVGQQLPLPWPAEPGHGPMLSGARNAYAPIGAAGLVHGATVPERLAARDVPRAEGFYSEMGALTAAGMRQYELLASRSGDVDMERGRAARAREQAAAQARARSAGQPRVTGVGTFPGRRFASVGDVEAAARPLGVGPRTAGLVDPNNLDVPTFLRKQGVAIAGAIRQQVVRPVAAEPSLQEVLNPPVAPPPTVDDEIGHPSISARALARAGLDPSGKPLSAEAGSPQARVQELLKSSREAVQLAQGTGQVRAVGTTTGGLFANLLGGKAQRELVARDLTTLRHALEGFTAEGSDAHRAFSRVTEAQTRFNQATLTGTGNVQALSKELHEAQQNAQPYVETVEAIGGQINKLQGQINPLKQATIGFASSIAGTIVGLGIFNAVSAGIQGIGNALEEPTDRLLGFRRTGERTAVSLGQMTRQMNGFSEGAVATATAQSGLGDSVREQIGPILDQRAAIEAGNSAFKEQLDLIRSAGFFARNPGAGITQTTGGLFGTPIGGTQPFLEQFLQSGSPVGGPLEGPLGRGVIGGALAAGGAGVGIGATAGLLGGPFGVTAGAIGGGLIGGAIGGVSGLLGGGLAEAAGSTPLAERARTGQLTDEETQRLEEFRQALASVNEGLEKANPQLKETAHFAELLGNTNPAADAAVAATQTLLSEMPGITEGQLDAAERLRFALIDPRTGKAPVTPPKNLENLLTEALRGLALPSREAAAFQQARGINAQLQLSAAQGRLQRESVIPGQSFLRQLFAGRAPTGGQVNIQPVSQGTAGLPPGVINREGIDTSQLTAGLGLVETQANKGREALVGMIKSADQINRTAGVPSNLLQQFNSLTEAAGKTAATIRSISQASAWMQVNLQVKQINEQIFLMSRSLEDAQSFLSGTGSGELGLLQNRARSLDIAQAELGFRQQSLSLANQELGIAASTLQLQQRQRQINFQRAIAGFVTPGQTPEEIAARQAEAKLEADFAQRGQDISVTQLENQKESVALAREQLGISKEQFAVQQAMIQVSAERAVGDLSRAIGLLQEQARVTVQLQVNSEAIEAYQTVLEEQKAQIENVITEAYNTQQTILTKSAELIATYGGTITSWQSMLLTQLSNYVAGANAIFASYGNTTTSGSTGTGGGSGGNQMFNEGTLASGYFQNVSTPTQMIVGEAGPETVAILRNPRSMTMQPSQGSGGVNINVMVTGNNVGSEQDADELAATIARKVEESMSRRTSLLGLRPN